MEHHSVHHQHQEAAPAEAKKRSPYDFSSLLTPTNLLALAIIAIILIVAVYFRTTMLGYYGFYEPDGFYHFSVIRAAVNNNFNVPHVLSISGWPNHAPVSETQGLYWMTLLPYFFLRFIGISYYTIMRNIAMVFGLLDIIGAYLLSRYLSKDKLFGILVMVFVALSGGNQARTSSLIYRGDSFVTLFLILALIMFAEMYRSKTVRRKLMFTVLSGIALAGANFVWNGAPFATVIYAFAFSLVVFFAFIFDRKDLVEDSAYVLLSLLIWFAVTTIFFLNGNILTQTLSGGQFFIMFGPMVGFWLIAYALTKYKQSMYVLVDRWFKRLAVLVIVALVAVGIVFVVFSGFVYDVLVGNGFIISAGTINQSNFASTIQELQPPTTGFLYASFANSVYATPSMLIVLLATYVTGHITLFFILASLALLAYFFMQIYDSGGFLSGSARVRFDFTPGLLALCSYFIITIYLQMHAIRFNSLISIPIAIFSAYTIYWLIAYIKQEGRSFTGAAGAVLLGAIIFGSVMIQIDTVTSVQSASWTMPLLFGACAFALMIFAYAARSKSIRAVAWVLITIFAVGFIYILSKPITSNLSLFWIAIPAVAILIVICIAGIFLSYLKDINLWWVPFVWLFIIALLYYNVIYTAGLAQADGINPVFIQALGWMKNNTPSNAVVLTLWPDGSVVEGIANRTSVTDSVGSQNYSKGDPFAAWLFNATPDPQFLTGPVNGRPSYLLVRNTWMQETSGILTEAQADVNYSANNYTYVQFLSFSENATPSTINLRFESGPQGNEVAIGSLLIETLNGSRGIQALLAVFNQSTGHEIGINAFKRVILYNQSDGQMSVINQTQIPNVTQDSYTLLMMYSGIPRAGAPINITQAYAVNDGLANSNMFKFLYLCSTTACIWDNNVATLQLVYANGDSKIFKINYNQS